MRVTINRIYAAYKWRWRLPEDICGICQQSFEQMCSDCTHPIECVPCVGVCHHCYHRHCIETWTTANTQCPICRSEWKELGSRIG